MDRKLHTIDARGKVAGRLASEIAVLLQGKHKVTYQPHTDCGDCVSVKNTAEMVFTGKKLANKVYYRHTRYPGGIIPTKLSAKFETTPDKVLRDMIYNMLPKNKLRARMLTRLTVSK